MNNKGFMMAEVIVVSSVVLLTLAGLYTSYNKIISIYSSRVDYYDIPTLYELDNIREINQSRIDNMNSLDLVINTGGTLVYYVDADEINLLSEFTINPTFVDYLDFISKSVTFDTDNILVMEKCVDTDKCKYAYLEVFK